MCEIPAPFAAAILRGDALPEPILDHRFLKNWNGEEMGG
jgi:hypothetical protein